MRYDAMRCGAATRSGAMRCGAARCGDRLAQIWIRLIKLFTNRVARKLLQKLVTTMSHIVLSVMTPKFCKCAGANLRQKLKATCAQGASPLNALSSPQRCIVTWADARELVSWAALGSPGLRWIAMDLKVGKFVWASLARPSMFTFHANIVCQWPCAEECFTISAYSEAWLRAPRAHTHWIDALECFDRQIQLKCLRHGHAKKETISWPKFQNIVVSMCTKCYIAEVLLQIAVHSFLLSSGHETFVSLYQILMEALLTSAILPKLCVDSAIILLPAAVRNCPAICQLHSPLAALWPECGHTLWRNVATACGQKWSQLCG